MALTYQNVLDQIKAAGLENQFSQYDLATAQKYPEFGAGMLSIKQDWNAATDEAGKTAASQAAEALRRQYGSYLGGSDGSKYYSLGPSPGSYQSPYQSEIDKILGQMGNYGSFSYGAAPTYNNRYQAEIDNLLDRVQNYEDFTWSKDTDPAYSAYAKQYRREGARATEDALAAAAAATGGQISTAAMTAASQAGDYYAGQLADAIPMLYENAYQRYLSEYSKLVDQLNQTQNAEQMDYNKYLNELSQYNTDRNFSYNQWADEYNMLGNYLSYLQSQDSTEYDRLMDQVGYNQDQQSLYQAQVDAILQAGGVPSSVLVGQSGYSDEYIQAIRNYYAAQQAAAASGSGGSGGGSRGSGGSGGGSRGSGSGSSSGGSESATGYEALFRAAYASGNPKSFLANNYKKYGFTSNTGLWDDYQAWAGQSGMNQDHYRASVQSVIAQLRSGNLQAAENNVNRIWADLSPTQQIGLENTLKQYGLDISG